MKRQIVATSEKAKQFLKWHDDQDNYYSKPLSYDKVYEILSKYGDENESVDVVFDRANPEDQDKMLALIKPAENTLGTVRYVIDTYKESAKGTDSYSAGFQDAIDACIDAGLLSADFVKKLER